VVRLLDGSRVQRKFSPEDKMQVVILTVLFTIQAIFDFIETKLPLQVEDHPNFEVVSNFPRKVFTDPNTTLKEAQLVPQGVLFLSAKP
jgi:hypothetical protein